MSLYLAIAIDKIASQPLPLADPVYVFCTVLIAIVLAPFIARFLKIHPVVVLIILGTILGKNVLGLLDRSVVGIDQILANFPNLPVNEAGKQALLKQINQQSLMQGLEKIGLLYIMLLAGLQMDLQNLRRLGVRSLVFGLLTFGVPFTIGVVSGQWLTAGGLAAVLLGILYSPHTLVSYPILTRFGIVQEEAVGVAVGGSVVTSVLTLAGLSIVQAVNSGKLGPELWINLLLLFPLLVFICFLGLPKLGKLIIHPDSEALNEQFVFVISCLFVIASATLVIKIDSIVGAFLAGLALNSLIPITSKLMKQIEFVGNTLFIPAFMISVGVLCNPKIFVEKPENLGIALAVIVGAVGGKFLAAWIPGLAFKYPFSEVGLMFSLTMSRAALVLVIALYGKTAELINEGIFNAIIVYIIVTCLIGPILTEIFAKQVVRDLGTDKAVGTVN
ncbi:cation:proton antiporter [Merismopedia glauca]|uniref:Cation:proton antiporter n=1 Tax=Merismopedia glauca CCAP 1448/3 TaxID=1296344 RepID=A0A2T1BXS0_9CYAN|nr:cation:proton antiporter [Merismopedia glauca]PSB00724.1 cation:proton antiporter [Merismopedia glauca CCAP 1448/3]